jgi:hypothetical protein
MEEKARLHTAEKCGFNGTSVGQDNTPFLDGNQSTIPKVNINPHARLDFGAKDQHF